MSWFWEELIIIHKLSSKRDELFYSACYLNTAGKMSERDYLIGQFLRTPPERKKKLESCGANIVTFKESTFSIYWFENYRLILVKMNL